MNITYQQVLGYWIAIRSSDGMILAKERSLSLCKKCAEIRSKLL